MEKYKPRVVSYDIECTGLKADFSFLLCAAFHEVGTKKVKLISVSQFAKDGRNPLLYEKQLVKAVAAEFAKADLLIGYYTTGFDLPYLNAKMLEYGLPALPPIPQVDLFYTAKSKLAVSRRSLQNVAYYIRAENSKTPVEGRLWKAAQLGSKKSLRQIEKHNIADVLVLSEVYEKLRPLVRTHPRVNGYGPCRYCGSDKLQRRGLAVTKLRGEQQRLHCQNCGGWDLRAA